MAKRYYSVSEAARYLGLSRRSMYYWVESGKVKTLRLPGWRKMLIDVEELERAKKLLDELGLAKAQATD